MASKSTTSTADGELFRLNAAVPVVRMKDILDLFAIAA